MFRLSVGRYLKRRLSEMTALGEPGRIMQPRSPPPPQAGPGGGQRCTQRREADFGRSQRRTRRRETALVSRQPAAFPKSFILRASTRTANRNSCLLPGTVAIGAHP